MCATGTDTGDGDRGGDRQCIGIGRGRSDTRGPPISDPKDEESDG